MFLNFVEDLINRLYIRFGLVLLAWVLSLSFSLAFYLIYDLETLSQKILVLVTWSFWWMVYEWLPNWLDIWNVTGLFLVIWSTLSVSLLTVYSFARHFHLYFDNQKMDKIQLDSLWYVRTFRGDFVRQHIHPRWLHGYRAYSRAIAESLKDVNLDKGGIPENMKKEICEGRVAGVGVFVVYKDSEQVLCSIRGERANGCRGCYQLPGGGVDPGEDPKDTARRELSEETGLDLKQERFYEWGYSYWKKDHGDHLKVSPIFVISITRDEKKKVQNLEPQKCLGWEWKSLRDMKLTGTKLMPSLEVLYMSKANPLIPQSNLLMRTMCCAMPNFYPINLDEIRVSVTGIGLIYDVKRGPTGWLGVPIWKSYEGINPLSSCHCQGCPPWDCTPCASHWLSLGVVADAGIQNPYRSIWTSYQRAHRRKLPCVDFYSETEEEKEWLRVYESGGVQEPAEGEDKLDNLM